MLALCLVQAQDDANYHLLDQQLSTRKSCIIGAVSRPHPPKGLNARYCKGLLAAGLVLVPVPCAAATSSCNLRCPVQGVPASACFQNRATFLPTRRRTTPICDSSRYRDGAAEGTGTHGAGRGAEQKSRDFITKQVTSTRANTYTCHSTAPGQEALQSFLKL